jgi:radical SAM protein with 4Fe4S-binding SPASM domain
MDAELCFSILDQCVEIGVCIVNLVGGEPWLRHDLVMQIAEKYDGLFVINMTTNGSVNGGMSRESAIRLRMLKSFSMNISLEASDSRHDLFTNVPGSFTSAIATLRTLVSCGMPVTVKTVACRKNSDDILGIAALAKSLGAAGFELLYPVPYTGQSFEEYRSMFPDAIEYEAILRTVTSRIADTPEFRVFGNSRYLFVLENTLVTPSPRSIIWHNQICRAGWTSLEIDTDGTVYPCSMLTSPEHAVGSLRTHTIVELWRAPKLDVLRAGLPLWSDEVCMGCHNLNWCRGGCRGLSLRLLGDVHRADPTCPNVLRGRCCAVQVPGGTAAGTFRSNCL